MPLDHNYFVYIVECVDGFYYTGVTNNLDRRIVNITKASTRKVLHTKEGPLC